MRFGDVVTGERLPRALGRTDLMRAFGISDTTFWRRKREGFFRPFELPRACGHKRWSGEKVEQFLQGRK